MNEIENRFAKDAQDKPQKVLAVISGVVNDKITIQAVQHGVKRKDAHKYNKYPNRGGCGTYAIGFPDTLHELNVVLKVSGANKPHKVDVKSAALELNERKNVTAPFVEALNKKLAGKFVGLVKVNGKFKLEDESILKV